MTQMSESKTRRGAAIGDSCVIPDERNARDPGSNFGFLCRAASNLGPGLRRGDDSCVIPDERNARGPGSNVVVIHLVT